MNALRGLFATTVDTTPRALKNIEAGRTGKTKVLKKNGQEYSLCVGSSYSCAPDEYQWEVTPTLGASCDDRAEQGSCTWTDSKSALGHVTCSKINPGIDCPMMGTVPASSGIGNEPLHYEADHYMGHLISCLYDPAELATSCEAVSAYTQAKRDEMQKGTIAGWDTWFDDDLMMDMCARQSTQKCPPISKKYGKCGNLVACQLCRQWAAAVGKEAKSDVVIDNWCEKHTDLDHVDDETLTDPSCRCRNFAKSHDFDVFSEAIHNGNPGCFYGPCKDKTFGSYMVESVFRQPCPAICEIDWTIIDSSDINIDNISQYIDCGGKPAPAKCTKNCGLHGKCLTDTTCACEPEWTGAACDIPETCADHKDVGACEDGGCEWCEDKCVKTGTCSTPQPEKKTWWDSLTPAQQKTAVIGGSVAGILAIIGITVLITKSKTAAKPIA